MPHAQSIDFMMILKNHINGLSLPKQTVLAYLSKRISHVEPRAAAPQNSKVNALYAVECIDFFWLEGPKCIEIKPS